MIRVLLVDDHPVVRSGYQRLLEQAGDIAVVAEAGDADTAYEACVRLGPDVCITDLSLPGTGGLALMRRVLQSKPDAKVLICSMHDAPQMVRRALEAGALGFVSKNASPDSLLAAVRATYEGRRYLSPNFSPSLMSHQPDAEAARLSSLTPREFEIFRLLASGKSPAECAALLALSSKTVANNQTLIKEKLAVSTSAALVHLGLRHGIIWPNA
jgi:DNA-binding NarL/FixJ family response regulator